MLTLHTERREPTEQRGSALRHKNCNHRAKKFSLKFHVTFIRCNARKVSVGKRMYARFCFTLSKAEQSQTFLWQFLNPLVLTISQEEAEICCPFLHCEIPMGPATQLVEKSLASCFQFQNPVLMNGWPSQYHIDLETAGGCKFERGVGHPTCFKVLVK